MKSVIKLIATLALTAAGMHAQTRPCSLPVILRITKPDTALIYQVDGHKPHKLYTLGEVSQTTNDCKPERMLFIVAASNVPVGEIHTEAKEQIEHVRYFVQLAPNDFWELGTDRYFRTLPITSDIQPEPLYDQAPPAPPSKVKGNK